MCPNISDFHIRQNSNNEISFKIGEAAKLKPLEVDLKRLEDLSDSIVQDFVHMRTQEEQMRDTNGM